MHSPITTLYPGAGRDRPARFARLRSCLIGLGSAIARNPGLTASLGAVLLIWGFALTLLAAAITHIVWCLKVKAWLYLLAGLIPLVSVIHGFMIWFGCP